MNRSTRDILFIFMGLFLSLGTLWASKTSMETRLGRDVAYLNTLGRSADGEKSLTSSLESQFMANSTRIKEMRRARLGYGDISVTLAMASHLKGGITRANVEKIVALWKSSRMDGWSRIAGSLGVRLGKSRAPDRIPEAAACGQDCGDLDGSGNAAPFRFRSPAGQRRLRQKQRHVVHGAVSVPDLQACRGGEDGADVALGGANGIQHLIAKGKPGGYRRSERASRPVGVSGVDPCL